MITLKLIEEMEQMSQDGLALLQEYVEGDFGGEGTEDAAKTYQTLSSKLHNALNGRMKNGHYSAVTDEGILEQGGILGTYALRCIIGENLGRAILFYDMNDVTPKYDLEDLTTAIDEKENMMTIHQISHNLANSGYHQEVLEALEYAHERFPKPEIKLE